MADRSVFQVYLEDIALQRRQAFTFDAEANAFVIGQLKGQGFYFEVFGFDRGLL